MENLIVVTAVVVGLAIWGRHAQVRWQNGSLADVLGLLARRVWPAKPLTAPQLDQRIWRRLCASLEPSVSGKIIVPATFVVWLAADDLNLIGLSRPAVEDHLGTELRRRAGKKGWTLTTGPVVAVRLDPEGSNGVPRVQHWNQEVPDISDLAEDNRWRPAGEPYGSDPEPEAPIVGLTGGVGAGPQITDDAPSTTSPEERRRLGVAGRETVPATAWCLVGADGRSSMLDPLQQPVVIGRSDEADLVLGARTVSGRHAELRWASGSWYLTDTGSRNGTFVNGVRRDPSADDTRRIQDGDELRFGRGGPSVRVLRSEVSATADHDITWVA